MGGQQIYPATLSGVLYNAATLCSDNYRTGSDQYFDNILSRYEL